MSLTRVALYRRTIRASLERIHENVHDWEHLPWLHRSSFGAIELLERGDWGWRARVAAQPPEGREPTTIELRFEPGGLRYVARTTEGSGKGMEVWTDLAPIDAARTRIEVEFLVPDVVRERAAALGEVYTALYTRLWDEDEAMMRLREERLRPRRGRGGPDALDLGPLETLRAHLPLAVELGGRPFRVVEVDGQLYAHSTVCPHRLGPLDDAPVEDGCVRCPWHGYRYDLASGASRDGAPPLRLETARIEVDPDTHNVRLSRGRAHEEEP